MKEKALYFGTKNFYQLIREQGGEWNDSKERPIVCLLKSTENKELYWAIPIGMWNHRDEKAKARILSYMNKKKDDIRSCFYHVGKTNKKSIFFISDVVPITDKYIEREYKGYNNSIVIIKNPNLIQNLTYKLTRILAFENTKPNYFRQHITDLKLYLLNELKENNNTLETNIHKQKDEVITLT